MKVSIIFVIYLYAVIYLSIFYVWAEYEANVPSTLLGPS